MATAPNKRKILIIDDDASLCEVLGLALEHAGFQVQGATDLEEAQKKILAYRPELILLDLLIPGTSGGEEIIAFLSQKGLGKLPVIVITGHYAHDAEYERRMRKEPNVIDFFKKPFNPVHIAKRIHEHFKVLS